MESSLTGSSYKAQILQAREPRRFHEEAIRPTRVPEPSHERGGRPGSFPRGAGCGCVLAVRAWIVRTAEFFSDQRRRCTNGKYLKPDGASWPRWPRSRASSSACHIGSLTPMNRISSYQGLAARRLPFRLFRPEPRRKGVVRWRINGHRVYLVLWSTEEWERLDSPPPDAQLHPVGVWCALRAD